MQRGCGASLPSVSNRYWTSAFAHGWNGAILSMSLGLTRNAPFILTSASDRLPTPVSQWPLPPAAGPKLTRPSGQCGVGAEGGLGARCAAAGTARAAATATTLTIKRILTVLPPAGIV